MGKLTKTLRARRFLQANDYTAKFLDEGQRSIRLPRTPFLSGFSRQGWFEIMNSQSFLRRPGHEVLLRKIVYLLYEKEIISRNRSVIDIGAWIGDNALVWAYLLENDKAKVIAIDPAKRNIDYIKKLIYLNEIDNIVTVTAVCADDEGLELHYEGNIDHTSFTNTGGQITGQVYSTTIDAVLARSGNLDIGFFHVDVEGMEKEVMTGGLEMIRKSRPVICFEQHMGTDPSDKIMSMLDELGYTSYMVNEVLPGNNLDCRNIFSFPSTVDANKVRQITQSVETKNPYFQLIPGNALIPFTPQ